ncbi:MAG: sialate O-acetylesterase, partial [Opitutae bacterium]|nr:sialate O-acetylesterase [Opitutae bacterium]
LYKDFRPPSASGETGEYYQKMLAEVDEALKNFGKEFPSLKGRKPEWGGFVWFQGWNDMFNQDALAQYEQNLVHLIKDLRAHLKQPNLPVVVGELGNMGEDAGKNMKAIREAQRKACERKEWKGRVSFVKTTAFARPKDESPNVGHGHHWFGNAESYFLIGDALGAEMVRLLKDWK